MPASYKDSTAAAWLSRVMGWVNGSGVAVPVSADAPLPVGFGSGSATATLSSLASAATTAQLLAANTSRKGVLIHNTDANALKIKYGTTASASSYSVNIPSNGYWEMPQPIYAGRIDAIWDADGAGSAFVTELT